DDGLQVIGMYHLKPRPGNVKTGFIRKAAKDLGFKFPIAIDSRWDNLNNYWFANNENRGFTSVSFLIDKKGIIRYIHPGPEYHKEEVKGHELCTNDYFELEGEITRLLN
ncbi:MAG: hypothetical protein IH946_11900, partial [Bacteroidetes bacterium]|nr:hypothetical protein [Bacteroidota bacterium]